MVFLWPLSEEPAWIDVRAISRSTTLLCPFLTLCTRVRRRPGISFLLPVCWFTSAVFALVVRSPIYAHFTETLGGLSAIRAFGHVNLFARTNERLVDNNLASHFALKVCILTCLQMFFCRCCSCGGGRHFLCFCCRCLRFRRCLLLLLPLLTLT